MCPYGYYEESETFYPHVYCKIDGKTCIYTKRCQQEQRYIPLNQEECAKAMTEEQKAIPTGSYYVITSRPSPNGTWVYIKINGNVQMFNLPIKDYKESYVYYDEKTKTVSDKSIEKPKKVIKKYGKKKNITT